MRKVSAYDLKRYQNRGRRMGEHFIAVRFTRHAWSFTELYGRSTRWARIFGSRQAGNRIEENLRRLRNELFDCISVSSTPFMDALRGK